MASVQLGQRAVLEHHYARLNSGAAAYVDETYSVQRGHKNFYVMSAVIVTSEDREGLREALIELVPRRWWHTSEELRRKGGREDTIKMLKLLASPHNACVIVETLDVAEGEGDEEARSRVFGQLLVSMSEYRGEGGEKVGLIVLERRKTNVQNNRDRRTRSDLVSQGKLPSHLQMVAVSPGVEHLLWLPDAVCSARRQQIVMHKSDLVRALDPRALTKVAAS